jgi:hypothetical protein
MARTKKEPALADLVSDTDLLLRFQDLREACFRGEDGAVIAYVLEAFLNNEGIDADPRVKERYERAREKRLAGQS